MQAKSIETAYAQEIVAYLQVHGVSVFKQALGYISEVKQSQVEQDMQPYLDAYCNRAVESLATQLFGINDVASASIAYIVHRDHFPPDDLDNEPVKRGFLARLTGSGD